MTNVTVIYTKSLLPFAASDWDDTKLAVPELKLIIGVEDCMGCPAYVRDFLKIAELLKRSRTVNKYSTVRAIGDVSRGFLVRSEFFRLCVRLSTAGSTVITKAHLNRLGHHSQPLTLTLIDPRAGDPPRQQPRSAAGSFKSEERSTAGSQRSRASFGPVDDDDDDDGWNVQDGKKKAVPFIQGSGRRPVAAEADGSDGRSPKKAVAGNKKTLQPPQQEDFGWDNPLMDTPASSTPSGDDELDNPE
jgi:hypothetical protein